MALPMIYVLSKIVSTKKSVYIQCYEGSDTVRSKNPLNDLFGQGLGRGLGVKLF